MSPKPIVGRTGSGKISRRRFLAAAASVAAGAVLAACQQAPAKPPAEGSVTPVPASGTSGEKVTFEMWMWETEPRWKQVQMFSGLDDKFPNVEFKWTALPFGDLHQKALTALAANMPQGLPNIVRTGAAYYRPFVNSKGLVDTTELVQKYKSDVMPMSWEDSIVNGKIYQLHDDTGVLLFGYRWDLFEKAGLPSEPDQVADLIKTYDDLINVGKTLDEAIGAKLFNMLPNAGVFNTLMLQDSTGYFGAEGQVIFDSDYHVTVAETTRKIFEAGVTSAFEQGPQQWQAYKDDQLACIFYANWTDFNLIDTIPETKGRWRVCKLPMVISGGKRATVANGCLLSIPASKPEDEVKLALEIGEYMKYTVKATLAHMKTFSGAFVSYVPGLEAMAEEPSPFLNNQFTYKLFLEAAQEENCLPAYRAPSAFWNDAATAAGNALFKILKDKTPAKEALTEAADSIRQLQKDKGIS